MPYTQEDRWSKLDIKGLCNGQDRHFPCLLVVGTIRGTIAPSKLRVASHLPGAGPTMHASGTNWHKVRSLLYCLVFLSFWRIRNVFCSYQQQNRIRSYQMSLKKINWTIVYECFNQFMPLYFHLGKYWNGVNICLNNKVKKLWIRDVIVVYKRCQSDKANNIPLICTT